MAQSHKPRHSFAHAAYGWTQCLVDENIKCSKCRNSASHVLELENDGTILFCDKHVIPMLKKIVNTMALEEQLRMMDHFMKRNSRYFNTSESNNNLR